MSDCNVVFTDPRVKTCGVADPWLSAHILDHHPMFFDMHLRMMTSIQGYYQAKFLVTGGPNLRESDTSGRMAT